jgi:hypothetical protein
MQGFTALREGLDIGRFHFVACPLQKARVTQATSTVSYSKEFVMTLKPSAVAVGALKTIRIVCKGKRETSQLGIQETVRCGATFELPLGNLAGSLTGPSSRCPFCQTPYAAQGPGKTSCNPFEKLTEAFMLFQNLSDRANVELVIPAPEEAAPDGSRLAWS